MQTIYNQHRTLGATIINRLENHLNLNAIRWFDRGKCDKISIRRVTAGPIQCVPSNNSRRPPLKTSNRAHCVSSYVCVHCIDIDTTRIVHVDTKCESVSLVRLNTHKQQSIRMSIRAHYAPNAENHWQILAKMWTDAGPLGCYRKCVCLRAIIVQYFPVVMIPLTVFCFFVFSHVLFTADHTHIHPSGELLQFCCKYVYRFMWDSI